MATNTSAQISHAQARRIALAAQGFGRPHAPVGTRQLNQLMHRLHVLQLDSVNVFERSHYLPVFARLGNYDRASLDTLTNGHRSAYVEFWAHQAAIIPVADWPLWGWQMQLERAGKGRTKNWGKEHEPMLKLLLSQLAARGPLSASQFEHESTKRTGGWWGWSDVRTGLEVLFLRGEITTVGRTRFERTYELAERRLPSEVVQLVIPKREAVRELVRKASRALGIGTVRDIADYWRLLQADTKLAIDELVEAGELHAVTVQGWSQQAWVHRDARIPRRIEGAALLSPFDPIVWERARTERMFDFFYRIEIYTPAPKRVFGYYTLPVLVDEALVGRIDLKTDRQARVLRVQSAWREGGQHADLDRIAELLRKTAVWQGMDSIEVAGRGDLAADLAGALRA